MLWNPVFEASNSHLFSDKVELEEGHTPCSYYSKHVTHVAKYCVKHFQRYITQVLCPFFNKALWIFALELYEFLIHLGYQPITECVVCMIFLILSVAFAFCWLFPTLCRNFLIWYTLYFCLCDSCFGYQIQNIIGNTNI